MAGLARAGAWPHRGLLLDLLFASDLDTLERAQLLDESGCGIKEQRFFPFVARSAESRVRRVPTALIRKSSLINRQPIPMSDM